jgi:nucleotidyltransferase substrate binding protein (TIGR01987 family)
MFHWLRDQGETVPEMQRAILQAAFRCELITDPETWAQIKEQRNQTSHTYNEATAAAVAAYVRMQALAAFDALRNKLQTL